MAVPAQAQPGAHWPDRVQVILATLAGQHPAWVADDTGPRLALNRLLAEQVCFELGPTWGMKTAGAGRPISSDVLAQQQGGTLLGWDWETQHNGTVDAFPAAMDLTGQVFVGVPCTDHFGGVVPIQPPPVNPPVIPSVDLTPALLRLDAIIARADSLAAQAERVYLDEIARINALSAQLRAHDDKPGAMEQTFGNRYVQIGLAILTTYLAQQQVTK